MSNAKGTYCLQLDGDVVVGPNYLSQMILYATSQNLDFVAAPVSFNSDNSLLDKFQVLDIIGMMALTQAGIKSGKWFLANGANMLYRNTPINIQQNDLASGDDVHRVEAFAKRDKSKIGFIKSNDAICHTDAVSSLKSLVNQRLRWGTKNKQNKNLILKAIMTSVYMNAMMMPIHVVMFIILGPIGLLSLCIHLLFKMAIDYIYLDHLSSFFKVKESMKRFLPISLIHIAYIILIGSMSLFVRKYNWKGRYVK